MNAIEEFSYYKWLEDLIRNRKKSELYLTHINKDEKDIEIMLLAEQIIKKNPKVLDDIIAGTVDATQNRNISQKDVLDFLSKTEKGTIVTWKDKDGNEYLFVNAGKGSFNKKRILILGEDFKVDDLNTLKKALARQVLLKDIKKVYEDIARKHQTEKRNKTYLKDMFTYLKDMFSEKNKIKNTASNFKKNFKKIVKEYNGISSMATVGLMVKTMSSTEKKKLTESFTAMGIKGKNALETTFNAWRNEAINEMQNKSKKPKIRHSMSQEHEMGM
ncbi:hypothetical protein [Treponema porcinum]|uniref:Uncharacterized protein n=1 Tax=Treponema porcinum TaxID=261392 RepID=A0A1T4JKF7_TREPO|nr:hypothetical protein [Treponema porcinum]SJZ30624.1 hypothetical protein SAMN02745149_00502 [Treponema porcinum]